MRIAILVFLLVITIVKFVSAGIFLEEGDAGTAVGVFFHAVMLAVSTWYCFEHLT